MQRLAVMILLTSLAACHPRQSNTDDPTLVASLNDTGQPDNRLWLTVQYADKHTCPSERCGVAGRMMFREAAFPEERQNGWVRISRRYDANCVNGRSRYIRHGNAACVASNGIADGQLAEWVRADQLSSVRPSDPADNATADEQLVRGSDDFAQHHAVFARLARQLIADGRCTQAEFEEQGGFTKSVTQEDEPVYFMYCGNMTIANQVRVNARTGTVLN